MKALDNLGSTLKHFFDKNEPVVLVKEKNYFSFLFFSIGAIIGSLAALSYTPDTGENNRKKIAEKLNALNEDKVKNNDRKSYKIREVNEGGIQNLEESKTNLTHF